MPIDTGKMAKHMGRMSPKEARSIDQDPARVPPHKKPKKYRLTLTYTRLVTETLQKDFPNKASMLDFRAQIEREMAKLKAKPPRYAHRYWGSWTGDIKMEGVELTEVKTGPDFTEQMLDGE